MYVEQKYTRRNTKNMNNPQKEAQTKITKGLLDLIMLQILNNKPMHGYQIITSIRKNFGVYFGPSTIYPMLSTLEKKGQVKSEWDMTHERPRKVYTLTSEGQDFLAFTEGSLNLICRKISKKPVPEGFVTTRASGSKRKTLSFSAFSS
jgi:PadR family transcriptional regulator PadR